MQAAVSIDIPAPVEMVWAIAQNPELRPLWDVRVARYEVHGEPGPGMEITITLRVGLLRPKVKGRLLRWAPPRQSVVQVVAEEQSPFVVSGAGSWTLEPIAGGTRYTSRFRLDLRQLHPLMPRWLYRWAVLWDTRRSFRRLRALVLRKMRKQQSAGS